MKKGFVLAFALLITVFCSRAWANTEPPAVPDQVIHDAILTLTWEDDGGEYWTEGHVVLGTKQDDDTVKVYVLAEALDYGFMDGVFTDTGGGFQEPLTLNFVRTDTGYGLKSILEPDDGDLYEPSLKKMMPADCIIKMTQNEDAYNTEITRQMTLQAQSYVAGIGRTEAVADWRDRDLQLPDMLTVASNQVCGFSPPYPLWVTDVERLENGVRYVYARAWVADADSSDGYIYSTPDGDTLQESGKTGVETLTKIGYEDRKIVETVTIRVEQYALTVTCWDDAGTKEYRLTFDGQTYHQPTVTETGKCGVACPQFEMACLNLPQ